MPSRHKRKLRVGVDIPTKEEATLVFNAAEGRWRPFFITAAPTGIRASEMRALIRDNVNFDNNVIHVTQRADMKRNIGSPKSEARARDRLGQAAKITESPHFGHAAGAIPD